jgi:hypothetical protein
MLLGIVSDVRIVCLVRSELKRKSVPGGVLVVVLSEKRDLQEIDVI